MSDIESVVSRRDLGFLCWAFSAMLTVAWLIEAFTVGRLFISTYLAPFAIVGIVVGVFLMRKSAGE
jgi:predicted membrane chloride channel (bestrophin family)